MKTKIFATTTLGSEPVLKSLGSILVELNDVKLQHRVTKHYHRSREELARLAPLKPDKQFYRKMSRLLLAERIQLVREHYGLIPELVRTHLKCAIVGMFRKECKR